ncbi:hypothetical protein [Marinivivus vitaminiproducens]|uniref:hypothetical protein n=1 Tax=Marinivivus vitaminiproducens TaxID=3035935 RepID=UPI00279EA1CC|nr:hypothetical protein P4R82_12765 [Geminicoccaceae bacterium SCSIO 64248]
MQITTDRGARRHALYVGIGTAIAALIIPRILFGGPFVHVLLISVAAGLISYFVQTRNV